MNGAAVLSYPSGEFTIVVSEYDARGRATRGKKRARTRSRRQRIVSAMAPFCRSILERFSIPMTPFVKPSGSNRRAFGQSVDKLRGKAEMHLKLVVKDGSLREAMIESICPTPSAAIICSS